MPAASAPIALRARWVFPICGPPLAGGVVTFAGERIVEVKKSEADTPSLDLGNVAILPGFVNAHTHLDLSGLAVPLGHQGIPFAQWLRCVIEYRRSQAAGAASAVERGWQECLRHGTTMLGDIRSPQTTALESPLGTGWSNAISLAASIDATVFLELIALAADRVDEKLDEARRYVSSSGDAVKPGLAPHAPYTVHPELLEKLAAISASANVPLAFHLAESPEEIELLSSQRGALADLLEELGAWDPSVIRPAARPLDYLQRLAAASKALVVHGNYLEPDELDFLARRADRLVLVYCPRTHAWFGHRRHPLPQLLSAGAAVALGTDSRASNPDLSLLEEMRHVARHFPELAPRLVLQLGTARGAAALGERWAGSLQAGYLANLAIVSLPEHGAVDPHELLFASREPVAATVYRGRIVHSTIPGFTSD